MAIWLWEGIKGSNGGVGRLDKDKSEPWLDDQILGLPEVEAMST